MSEIKSYENMPVMTVLRIFRDVFLKLKLQEVAADLKSGKSLVESLNDFGKAVEIVAKVYEYANSSKVSGQKSLIEKLGDLGDLLECTTEALNDFIDLVDGIANNTKTKGELAKAGTSIASNIVEAVDAIKSISGGSSIILPVSALIIKAIAENFATIDGIKYEDLQKVASALVDINIELGKGIAEKLYPDNARLSADLGPVALGFSALSGIITGATDCMATIEEYKANGIPEDIAWHDGIVILITSALKETATKYTNGADDVLFKWLRGFASWVTKTEINYEDKDYMELWAEAFKKLNVYNTGDDNDNLLIAQSVDNHTEIYGKGGNDAISNFASYVTIWGGNDNDTIFSHSDWKGQECVENSLLGGMGDDVIITYAKLDSLYGGKGEDLLAIYGNKNTAYGEEGKDKIAVYGNNNWVFSGTDDDILILDGVASGNKIYGDEGNDTIASFENANSNTINGGAGNDRIIISNTKNQVIQYISGDGDDEIIGYDESDTITISGSSYKTSVSGQDVIIMVGNGSIKLYGAKGKKININNSVVDTDDGQGETSTPMSEIIIYPAFWSNSNIIRGTNGNNTINNTLSSVMIEALAGNDSIDNYGKYSTIDSGKGNDLIYTNANDVCILSGEGDDSIYAEDNSASTIYSDIGDDYINNGIDIALLDGGDGNDIIYNNGWEVTIAAGAGDDSIYNSGGGGYRGWGSIRIINYGGRYVSINGGSGNDYITNDEDYVTIVGGSGDDLIIIKDFVSHSSTYCKKNVFYYSNGDGHDTIIGFNNDDTLKICNESYSIVQIESDIIVKVGNGSILLKNAKDIELNIQGTLAADTVATVETAKNISNTISNTIISGTKYADTISNSASRVTINGGDNNDSISSVGDKVSISGGNGNDTVYSDVAGSIESGENVTIDGGTGEDYISNDSSYSRLEGKDGNDTIINYGWNTSIYGGVGNDVINNFNAFTGEGNNVLISGGAGKDSLTSTGQNDSIYGDEGNDTIYGWNSNILVDGGADNDYIYAGNYETNTSIYGGAGDDTIANFNSKSYIGGGKGNDLIYNDNQPKNVFLYESGDGNDTIYGYNANDTVKITGEKYSSVKSGSDLKVNVGNGSILIKDAANIAVKIVGTMESGSPTNETLQAGMSLKSSVLTASTAFKGNRINLEDYDATKINVSALTQNVTIIGSSAANSVKGGKGADIISGVNGKNTIYGGTGNDSILGGSDSDKLLGETGNDTLNGGTGNDTLTGGAGQDVFIYSGGNDIITDYNTGEDKIKTGTITNSTVKGSDVILTTGNGNLTIKGAKDKVVTLEDNSGNSTDKIFYADTSYTPLETGLSYDAKRTILTASSKFSGNEIDLGKYLSTVTKVNASALIKGISIVSNSSANNSIKGGKGADTISGNSGKDTISGGTGNDSIFGGTDNDKLLGEAGNDTLNGGTGNDTLTGGAGQDVFIYSGGNDIITDYNTGEDKTKLNPSAITSSTVKGSDIVLTTNNGTLTVKGAKDKVITFVGDNGSTSEKIFYANVSYAPLETGLTYDAKRTVLTASNKYTGSTIYLSEYLGTVTKINATASSQALNIVGNSSANSIKAGKGADTINGGSGKDTITGGNGNDSILGGVDNDLLKGDAGNDTLNGGNGNDTLTGGAGNDLFVYEGGSDSITDYKSGEDKIKLSPSSITSSTVKGSDVILTTSNGTLTVKATKDKVITFVGNNGSTTDKIFYSNTSYEPLATGLTYDAKRTVLTSSNKFTGSTIDLGEYLGTVTKINAAANSQPLNIIGNSSANNSIKGGKGADTISGGKGNDTLTGGGGSDVFVYQGGNDIITDYTSGQDSIKVSGSISNVSYNGKNVIFSIGTGSLTVTNAKGKDIAVSDSSNKTQTYSRTIELLYDNNFMTDEFDVDSISEVTETNYSVGKIEYSNNTNDFMINSVVADSSFDKK